MVGADFKAKTYSSGSCSGVQCSDVLVGAPGESLVAGAFSHGVAHYFQPTRATASPGSVTADNGAIDNVPGKPLIEGFQNVRIAGDVNGDGYADVISPMWYTGAMSGLPWGYPATLNGSMRWGAVVSTATRRSKAGGSP